MIIGKKIGHTKYFHTLYKSIYVLISRSYITVVSLPYKVVHCRRMPPSCLLTPQMEGSNFATTNTIQSDEQSKTGLLVKEKSINVLDNRLILNNELINNTKKSKLNVVNSTSEEEYSESLILSDSSDEGSTWLNAFSGGGSRSALESMMLTHHSNIPNFGKVAELYYNHRKDNWLRMVISSYLGSKCSSVGSSRASHVGAMCQQLVYLQPDLVRIDQMEIAAVFDILKECGLKLVQLVPASFLLTMPSVKVQDRYLLLLELGLVFTSTGQTTPGYAYSPLLAQAMFRLEGLMELPVEQLSSMSRKESNRDNKNNFSSNGDIIDNFLVACQHKKILDANRRINYSPQTKFIYLYLEVLSRYLAKRFRVEEEDVRKVLRQRHPALKPLSHYHIVCDILCGPNFKADWPLIAAKPELLDILPMETMALLRNGPVGGTPAAEFLRSAPLLAQIPNNLLKTWLTLLDKFEVTEFPPYATVAAVLQRDYLFTAELSLSYLRQHHEWQMIKSSAYLFKLFEHPHAIDKLMSGHKNSKFKACSIPTDVSEPTATTKSTSKSTVGFTEPVVSLRTKVRKMLNSNKVTDWKVIYPLSKHYDTIMEDGLGLKQTYLQPNPEVLSYLGHFLNAHLYEMCRIGINTRLQMTLLNVVAVLELLTSHGFSRDQMVAGIDIFAFHYDLIALELAVIPDRLQPWSEWRKSPNVVSLLLYYVVHKQKNVTACHPIEDDAAYGNCEAEDEK